MSEGVNRGTVAKNRKKPLWKRIMKGILAVVLVVVLCFVSLLVGLTITEYKPEPVENVSVKNSVEKTVSSKKPLTILSWNIGYGALGDDADFFMDGGKSIRASNEKRVKKNLTGITTTVDEIQPDIALFQEVDVHSKRSYYIDQQRLLSEAAAVKKQESAFATNYKVPFVPYPVPPIGKVEAGIETTSAYHSNDTERIQLPTPFGWPYRLENLKRCLLVSRMPIAGSKKELVVVNLHLEAYDDGKGKAAQTKKLFDLLNREIQKGNYVIAGGDFNQTFSSTDISGYKQNKELWKPGLLPVEKQENKWQFRMDRETPSCRSLDVAYAGANKESFQYYVIDGFIVSKNIQITQCQTIQKEFVHADHNPVLLKIRLQ